MSDQLQVDLAMLEAVGRELDVLAGEFQRAGEIVDDARSAVGSDHLAGRLDEFVDGWKVRREDYLEDITYLADMTREAARTYRQVDDELAAALETSAG